MDEGREDSKKMKEYNLLQDLGYQRTLLIHDILEYLLPKDLILLLSAYDFNIFSEIYQIPKNGGPLLYYENQVYIVMLNNLGKQTYLWDTASQEQKPLPGYREEAADAILCHDGWFRLGDCNYKKPSCYDALGDSYYECSTHWIINKVQIPKFPDYHNLNVIFKRQGKLFTANESTPHFYWKEADDRMWKMGSLQKQKFPLWSRWTIFKDKFLVLLVKHTFAEPFEPFHLLLYFYEILFCSENLNDMQPFFSVSLGETEQFDDYSILATEDVIYVLGEIKKFEERSMSLWKMTIPNKFFI